MSPASTGCGSYYLNNLIGNPLDTTIAAACLIFGGVLERHPKLNFVMVHGGGFMPYQGGRWVHGWHVRPEPKVKLKAFAGAVSRPLPLRHHSALQDVAGVPGLVGRRLAVFLGSDYPYDMGTLECVRQVRCARYLRKPTAPPSSAVTPRDLRARSGVADDAWMIPTSCACRRARSPR